MCRAPVIVGLLSLTGCGRVAFDTLSGDAGIISVGMDAGVAQLPPGLPSKGLVGYWAFDEGQGATSRDLSGNGRDGTLVAMEPEDWVPGIRGTALDLEDDDYFEYGCAGRACPETEQAIAFWFSADALQGALVSYFAGERYESNVHKTIAFSGNYLHVGPAADKRGAPITMFATGTWYHVVCNYIGTASTVFIDGVDVTVPSDDYWNAGSFTVGRRIDYSPMQYDGRIDELVIYDHQLTTTEIAAVRAATQ